MKNLLVALLGGVGAIASATTAVAQPPKPVPVQAASQGAALLQTNPITVKDMNPTQSGTVTILQAKPDKPASKSLIPEDLAPKTPKAIDPLDFFAIPKLQSGVKLTVSRD
jgi:hypothetical protein